MLHIHAQAVPWGEGLRVAGRLLAMFLVAIPSGLQNEGLTQGVLVVKNLPANAGDARDTGLIPKFRSPGEGNGTPLQHSCLENPVNRGAWQAAVCGVTL